MFIEHGSSYQGPPLRVHAAAVGAGWPEGRKPEQQEIAVAEISVVLVMLVAVVLSQAITLVLPFGVPRPLVQIALSSRVHDVVRSAFFQSLRPHSSDPAEAGIAAPSPRSATIERCGCPEIMGDPAGRSP